jgi:hypothetical protein
VKKRKEAKEQRKFFKIFLLKLNTYGRRKIRLIESNAKCRYLKIDLNREFAAGVFLFEAPSPPRVLFEFV